MNKVVKQSKGCKFMPKMRLAAPLGELMRSPDPLAVMGAYF